MVAHPQDLLGTAAAATLAGGTALYLLGDCLFRLAVGVGRLLPRLVAALLVALSVLLATAVPAWASLAVVVLVVLLLVAASTRLGPDAETAVG